MLDPTKPRPRLLVADDDDELRGVLRRVLEREGYAVTTAADGAQARALLDGSEFDFLVSDIQMPGLDGFALMAQARALHPALRVVLITAYPTLIQHNEAVARGAVECLPKPFKIPELLVLLDRARSGG